MNNFSSGSSRPLPLCTHYARSRSSQRRARVLSCARICFNLAHSSIRPSPFGIPRLRHPPEDEYSDDVKGLSSRKPSSAGPRYRFAPSTPRAPTKPPIVDADPDPRGQRDSLSL